MLPCPSCGEPSLDGARFCPACGSALAVETPKLRKTITALFCDLAGSTALAESLDDPEAIHDVLTRYLRAMTTVIERHGGTVEKFAGDAVLGTFGAPISHEDDALRAVRAAVEMRDALSSLNADLGTRWGVSLELKIGINTGEAMTGGAVAGQALALGDPVNVAARLEQTAEPGDIILGEQTVRLAGYAVSVDRPRPLQLKGKSVTVNAYRLVTLTPDTAMRRHARPMAGRTAEVQTLRDAFDLVVRDGTAQMLVLLGPAGIGKSRIVTAFADAVAPEAYVYTARCPSYGERTTYWPVAQIVRAHAGLTADDTASLETAVARAVAAITGDRGERAWIAGHLLSLVDDEAPARTVADPGTSPDAWLRFLRLLASRRPLVLVIEDLQWAGDGLLALLDAVAASDAPILVLGTARPEVDERVQGTSATVVAVPPLGPDAIGTLVDAISALPPAARAQVIARAGGNPLFAAELAQAIADRHATDDRPAIPNTIESLVAARLDALPPPVRALVADAAVVGSSITADALAATGAHDATAVRAGLDVLVRRELLQRASGLYEFGSDLVREVAYQQIPRAARSAKHHAYAEWTETNAPGAAEVLADHDGRALDLAIEAREDPGRRALLAARAFRSRVRAAGRAVRAADPASGISLLVRAVSALAHAPAPDRDVVAEAGRLFVALGRWDDAVALLARFAEPEHPVILRELGIAMCKLNADDPGGDAYRLGQGYLEKAAAYDDPDAIASLAGTWKGIDDERVLALYRRAGEIDPTDPYALGNRLEYEVRAAGNLSPVDAARADIARAVERCRREAAESINLPWAEYDAGKFHLLLGVPEDSLHAYARAVDLSPAAFMVETSLASLARLAEAADGIAGIEHVTALLSLALRTRFGPNDEAQEGSVVILAGGTTQADTASMASVSSAFSDAFEGFTGTIVSGGTGHGVGGLAAVLGGGNRGARTVGYLPRTLPPGIEPDARYDEIRRTDGSTFSALEPLAYWDDLARAGIAPRAVTVIGIGGGPVAATEFAIALALGARLGVVMGTGRAADEILRDPHWSSSPRLSRLEPDAASLRAFLAAS